MNTPRIYYVMGVSGSGKSTIGKLLADKLNISFYDADDFHPQANIDKMAKGHPLNDDDRAGWLQSLNEKAVACVNQHKGAVIACSSLKNSYREILVKSIENNTNIIFLNGSFDLISKRLALRKDHFMPPGLLESQFETLQEPSDAIEVSINQSPTEIIEEILTKI